MQERIVKTKMYGKDEIFKVLALGEALKLPVLLLGPPGVGKTQALLDYATAIYGDKEEALQKSFIIELDEGTKTSEVKGRVNMKTLLEDKKYEVEAPIADAEYILLNEVDKCNSGIRNTMLSLMRERTLFFGDKVIPCKWKVLAASCNEIPDDESDSPFWDRFVLTYKVERVGIDGIVNYWKDMTMKDVRINIPSGREIIGTQIHKSKVETMLNVVYECTSDRTASYLPTVAKAIKAIYGLEDVEALMKTCEFVCPTKVADLSGKLETARVASLRSQIKSLSTVINGNDKSYAQMYLTQLITDIKELGEMTTYKKKSGELMVELQDYIGENYAGTEHEEIFDKENTE